MKGKHARRVGVDRGRGAARVRPRRAVPLARGPATKDNTDTEAAPADSIKEQRGHGSLADHDIRTRCRKHRTLNACGLKRDSSVATTARGREHSPQDIRSNYM